MSLRRDPVEWEILGKKMKDKESPRYKYSKKGGDKSQSQAAVVAPNWRR